VVHTASCKVGLSTCWIPFTCSGSGMDTLLPRSRHPVQRGGLKAPLAEQLLGQLGLPALAAAILLHRLWWSRRQRKARGSSSASAAAGPSPAAAGRKQAEAPAARLKPRRDYKARSLPSRSRESLNAGEGLRRRHR
jgi:hypothetical protein